MTTLIPRAANFHMIFIINLCQRKRWLAASVKDINLELINFMQVELEWRREFSIIRTVSTRVLVRPRT